MGRVGAMDTSSNVALGYVYMLVSTTSFTAMAAVSKILGTCASTEEKVFWRSLVSICFTISSSKGLGFPKRIWLLLLRGCCGHIALTAYLESLNRIPLAEAVFLGKIHPVSAAILSYFCLGETLSATRALGILVSFLGVTLISKPSWEALVSGDLLGHLLALLAGILSGAAYCCVRSLSRGGEDERWTLLALPLISLPFCAKDAMLGASKHEASTWGWLLMLGLCTQLGQLFLVRGLQILPCASGTQAMYFGTLSGVVLGSILGEGLPTPETSLGAVLIVGSLHLAEWAESKESSKEGKVD